MTPIGAEESLSPDLRSPWTQYPDKPQAKLVKIIRETETETTIPCHQAMEINVDRRQRAFHDGPAGGGLPVELGTQLNQFAEGNERNVNWGARVDTIDLHDQSNLSLADTFNVPPFSTLSIENGRVIFTQPDGKTKTSYDQISKGEDYPPEQVLIDYLRRKQIFRTFVALAFNTQITGVEQTLWPKHATVWSEETDYLKRLESNIQPDLTVLKGGEGDRLLGKDPKRWGADSYSGIFNVIGEVVTTCLRKGGGVEETNAGQAITRLLQEKGLTAVVLNGIAYTHCVKDTAEGLRLMQVLSNPEIVDILRQRFEAMKKEGKTDLNWQDIQNLYRYYIENKMTLDPKYLIAVNVEKCAPVQLGEDQKPVNQFLVDSTTQALTAMGVRLITDNNLLTK